MRQSVVRPHRNFGRPTSANSAFLVKLIDAKVNATRPEHRLYPKTTQSRSHFDALLSVQPLCEAVRWSCMSRILIIGATGTVGRQVVAQLTASDVQVRAMVRKPDAARLPPQIELMRGDLTLPETMYRWVLSGL